jgi:hypothetical protein
MLRPWQQYTPARHTLNDTKNRRSFLNVAGLYDYWIFYTGTFRPRFTGSINACCL